MDKHPSRNRDNFIYFFHSNMIHFIYLYMSLLAYLLTCLSLPYCAGGISSTMLNRNGERGHLCLVSNFRERIFSLSSLTMMLSVGILQMPFIRLRKFPSIPSLLSSRIGVELC